MYLRAYMCLHWKTSVILKYNETFFYSVPIKVLCCKHTMLNTMGILAYTSTYMHLNLKQR